MLPSISAIRDWLSDHGLLVAAVGAPIAVFALIAAVLLVEYRSQTAEQKDLEEQIRNFSEIARRSQTRTGDTEAEFAAIQDAFPSGDLTEIDVFRTMRGLAEGLGLDINQMTIEQISDVPSAKKGKLTYRVISFRMTTAGKFDRVLSLVHALDQGRTAYKTLVLDKLDMTVGEESSATMEFKIYGLPG